MGDPDMPHAYTNVADVARALAILGEREDGLGKVWHIPTPPAESTRAVAQRIGAELGLHVDVVRVPKLLLRAVGLFNPFVREIVEMTYQWEVPFEVDDRRFRSTFGMEPTPIEEAVAETAAWARARFGAKRAA
jgi:nucleoside-diphosphate-sugar epimerase